jgi:leucine dehydrogenase
MKGALRHVFGSDDLSGRTVAIQGVGNVGFNLARLVTEAGGTALVSDVRSESVERATRELGATAVATAAIVGADCDVFAPCAMGGIVSEETIPALKARIVCGGANNQLSNPEAGRLLLDRGIAYAPDYVANAGGILNAFGDFTGHHDIDEVWRKVNAIGDTVEAILETAQRENRPSSEIADAMAEAILQDARTAAA